MPSMRTLKKQLSDRIVPVLENAEDVRQCGCCGRDIENGDYCKKCWDIIEKIPASEVYKLFDKKRKH